MPGEKIRDYQLVNFVQNTSGIKIYKARRRQKECVIQIISLNQTYVHETADIEIKEAILESNCIRYLQMKHTNLASIYDIFLYQMNENRCLIVAEELFFNENTIKMIKQSKDMDAQEIKSILVGLAEAIEYLHTNNILHGNISMATIKKKGEVYKLYLSSLKEVNLFRRKYQKTRYDKSDIYTSPEKHNQQGYSFPADIWSFAIIIIQFLLKDSLINHKQSLPCCQLKFPSHQLLLKLPNNKIRELVSSMLQQDPLKRPVIRKVRQILQNINFDQTDNDIEEQIQEAIQYEKFQISLFKPQNIDMTVNHNNLSISKNIKGNLPVRLTRFQTSSHYLTIYMPTPSSLSINSLSKSLNYSQNATISYSSLNPKIREYFSSVSDLFDEIQHCSSQQIRMSGCGEVEFSFDRQRCEKHNSLSSTNESQKTIKKQQFQIKQQKQKQPNKRRQFKKNGTFIIRPIMRATYMKITQENDPQIIKIIEEYEYQPHLIFKRLQVMAYEQQIIKDYTRAEYYKYKAICAYQRYKSYFLKMQILFQHFRSVRQFRTQEEGIRTQQHYFSGIKMLEQKEVFIEDILDGLQFFYSQLLHILYTKKMFHKIWPTLIKYHTIILQKYENSLPSFQILDAILYSDWLIHHQMGKDSIETMKILSINMKIEGQSFKDFEILFQIFKFIFFKSKSQLTDVLLIFLDSMTEIIDKFSQNEYKKIMMIQNILRILAYRHRCSTPAQLQQLESWIQSKLPEEMKMIDEESHMERFYM